MQIQKPTVLDTARVSEELKSSRGAGIINAWSNESRTTLFLQLDNKNTILQCTIERKYAFLGITDELPSDIHKTAPLLNQMEITDISQINNDRIISIELIKIDRLGRAANYKMIIELMPQKGNIFLLDKNGRIQWSLKNSDALEYKAPSQLKKPTILNLDNLSFEIEDPAKLPEMIFGLNDRDVQNLKLENMPSVAAAIISIRQYTQMAKSPGPAWIIFKNDTAIGYSLANPQLEKGEYAERFDSALKMYATYYRLASNLDDITQKADYYQKLLEREISRQNAKLADIERSLSESENASKYKLIGELILANMDVLKKGSKSAKLTNYEGLDPEYIDAELDPAKSISANAEAYFNKYKKANSSISILTRRHHAISEKLSHLRSILNEVEADPESLERELTKLKLMPPKTNALGKRQIAKRIPYRIFKSSSGWDIFVGKSNRDNDELTLEIASKNDYWFHAWQAAGSHTVLRLPNKSAIPDKQTLIEAASLAAYFSKAKNSSKVPVAYTQVKYVRKPRNFPPGKVIVEKEKQLIVKPADPKQFSSADEE